MVGVLVQYLLDIRGIVFAAECQNEPSLLKIQQPALEREIGIAGIFVTKGDAVEAILADYAAPEGVICIERYHLDFWKLQGGAQPDHAPRKLAGRGRGKRESRRVPEPGVEECLTSDLRYNLVEVKEQRRRDSAQTTTDIDL